MFFSFEIIPFIMFVLLMFAPMLAELMNNRLQYGWDFSDKVALYSYISIMSVYVITILLEIVFYFKLLKNYQYIDLAHVPFYIIGFLAAFIVGLIAIKTFLHLINKVKLVPFAIYRIVLVIFIAILYFGFGIGKGI